MRLVILESPYAASEHWTVEQNVAYARACLLDCLQRGEAPLASHLLYTQVLADAQAAEREVGISAGLHWAVAADATVVYLDHGMSEGMRQGIEHARTWRRPVEMRRLPIPHPLSTWA